MLVCLGQDIVPVSLGLNCSWKGTSEATTESSLKESQMLSPEGSCLHDFFSLFLTSFTAV